MELKKKTERLLPNHTGIARAAEVLRNGGTVAFPTETVYGLGANALDVNAVEGIFRAKERPHWDPLIIHVADQEMLLQVVSDVSEKARKLMEAFWPGALTLLLPRSSAVPDAVTANRSLVGIRMPQHPVALRLIREAGVPIAAPSANRFGRTSPTTAEHVLEDLDGRIDAVLDGGATGIGVESTVLDPTQSPMVIYRPGAVTQEMIQSVAGDVEIFQGQATLEEPESLPSPGVAIRHYAPRATLYLFDTSDELERQLSLLKSLGKCVGVMLPKGWRSKGDVIFSWGDWGDPAELARRVFAGLRELDRAGVDVILCPRPIEQGLGLALRDRLGKAAK